MRSHVIAFGVAACIAHGWIPVVSAQETPASGQLSLVEAVQHALDKHPLLQIQQRELDFSQGLRQQASSQFDTTLSWNGSQSRTNLPLTLLQQAQAAQAGFTTTNQASNLTDYSIQGQKLLRSGILINPVLSLDRNTDNLTNHDGVNQSHFALQVVLPLMRNRGRDVVTAQERSAEFGVDASRYDTAEVAAELIANTVVAYWNYVAAMNALEVVRGSEERGRALTENVQVLIDADRLARSELNDVTANVADRVTSRIAAEQQVVQARQALGVAMGLDIDQIARVPLPSDSIPNGMNEQPPLTSPESLQRYVNYALTRRPDYLAAGKRQQAAEVLTRAARNQLHPQLDFTFTTGYSGMDEGRRPDRIVGSAFQEVRGADAIAGLRYTFAPRNNYAQGQLLQASARWEQSRLRSADLGRTIASDVIVAAMGLANSITRLRTAHQAVVAFQSALEGERDKLRLGVGSLVDILTIEDRLTAALTNEVSARLAYGTSLIRFRFVTGTLIAPDRAVQTVERSVLFSAPFQPGEPIQ